MGRHEPAPVEAGRDSRATTLSSLHSFWDFVFLVRDYIYSFSDHLKSDIRVLFQAMFIPCRPQRGKRRKAASPGMQWHMRPGLPPEGVRADPEE